MQIFSSEQYDVSYFDIQQDQKGKIIVGYSVHEI